MAKVCGIPTTNRANHNIGLGRDCENYKSSHFWKGQEEPDARAGSSRYQKKQKRQKGITSQPADDCSNSKCTTFAFRAFVGIVRLRFHGTSTLYNWLSDQSVHTTQLRYSTLFACSGTQATG